MSNFSELRIGEVHAGVKSTRLIVCPNVWNIRPGGALAGGTCISYGAGLSAIRATAAGHDFQALDFLAHGFVEYGVGQEDQPVRAGVGALEAGVMRLHGLVVILGGWVRGRFLCGHRFDKNAMSMAKFFL
jgi:hypothetical protein